MTRLYTADEFIALTPSLTPEQLGVIKLLDAAGAKSLERWKSIVRSQLTPEQASKAMTLKEYLKLKHLEKDKDIWGGIARRFGKQARTGRVWEALIAEARADKDPWEATGTGCEGSTSGLAGYVEPTATAGTDLDKIPGEGSLRRYDGKYRFAPQAFYGSATIQASGDIYLENPDSDPLSVVGLTLKSTTKAGEPLPDGTMIRISSISSRGITHSYTNSPSEDELPEYDENGAVVYARAYKNLASYKAGEPPINNIELHPQRVKDDNPYDKDYKVRHFPKRDWVVPNGAFLVLHTPTGAPYDLTDPLIEIGALDSEFGDQIAPIHLAKAGAEYGDVMVYKQGWRPETTKYWRFPLQDADEKRLAAVEERLSNLTLGNYVQEVTPEAARLDPYTLDESSGVMDLHGFTVQARTEEGELPIGAPVTIVALQRYSEYVGTNDEEPIYLTVYKSKEAAEAGEKPIARVYLARNPGGDDAVRYEEEDAQRGIIEFFYRGWANYTAEPLDNRQVGFSDYEWARVIPNGSFVYVRGIANSIVNIDSRLKITIANLSKKPADAQKIYPKISPAILSPSNAKIGDALVWDGVHWSARTLFKPDNDDGSNRGSISVYQLNRTELLEDLGISATNDNIARIEGELSSIKNQISTAGSVDAGAIENRLSDIEAKAGKIDEIESRVNALSGTGGNNEALENVTNRLTDTEQRIYSLESKVGSFEPTDAYYFRKMKEEVAELKRDVGKLKPVKGSKKLALEDSQFGWRGIVSKSFYTRCVVKPESISVKKIELLAPTLLTVDSPLPILKVFGVVPQGVTILVVAPMYMKDNKFVAVFEEPFSMTGENYIGVEFPKEVEWSAFIQREGNWGDWKDESGKVVMTFADDERPNGVIHHVPGGEKEYGASIAFDVYVEN